MAMTILKILIGPILGVIIVSVLNGEKIAEGNDKTSKVINVIVAIIVIAWILYVLAGIIS